MNARLWWGIAMIVAGFLFLLDGAGTLDVGALVSDFWPLVLIVWGAWLLLRRRMNPEKTVLVSGPLADIGIGPRVEEVSAERIRLSNIFGDLRCRAQSKALSGGSLSSVFGDVDVDLTAAELLPGEHLLKIDTVLGDIDVVLPAGAAFTLAGDSVLGKIAAGGERRSGFFPSLEYATPGYKGALRRIRVDASTVLGSVLVQQKAG